MMTGERFIGSKERNEEDTINKILFLLEISQAKDYTYMSSLIQQMENMENQIKELNLQLALMREQIPQKKGIRERMEAICSKAEEKGNQALNALRDVKAELADKGRSFLEDRKQSGEIKIYSFLDKTHLQEKLCAVQQRLNDCVKSLESSIQKADKIMDELHQGREHVKSAIGIAAGKEAETNSTQEKPAIISRVLRAELKAYQAMQGKTDQLILAYDRLEESVIKKNPSVLKKIGQFKEERKENDSATPQKETDKNKMAETER